jgi:small subunit ribosomal protein S20
MPVVHKSTIKRARQALKRNERNRAALSALKSVLRRVTSAVEQKNAEQARTSLREATSAVSKAVSKGVMKRNTASRRISQLATQVNSLGKKSA